MAGHRRKSVHGAAEDGEGKHYGGPESPSRAAEYLGLQSQNSKTCYSKNTVLTVTAAASSADRIRFCFSHPYKAGMIHLFVTQASHQRYNCYGVPAVLSSM